MRGEEVGKVSSWERVNIVAKHPSGMGGGPSIEEGGGKSVTQKDYDLAPGEELEQSIRAIRV